MTLSAACLDVLAKSTTGRTDHVAYRFVAYGQSKLANILFVKEFASRNAGSNVSAFAVHPGTIATK